MGFLSPRGVRFLRQGIAVIGVTKMNTDTRLSVIESRDEWISSIVKSSIGWTLVLTVAVVGAVLAVNSQFDSLEGKFDRKFDALESKFDQKIDALQNTQNLILQNISPQSNKPDGR